MAPSLNLSNHLVCLLARPGPVCMFVACGLSTGETLRSVGIDTVESLCKDTLTKGHFSKEGTVCSLIDIDLCAN